MRGVLCFGACALFLAAACSSSKSQSCVGTSSPLCTGTGRCVAIAACASETDIVGRLRHGAGRRHHRLRRRHLQFNNELALGTANGVTVIGAGQGRRSLDFARPAGRERGPSSRSRCSNLTFEGFTVQNTPGNGIKVLVGHGASRSATIEVNWTALDRDRRRVRPLPRAVEERPRSRAAPISGASDSGIYIGQSQQIVVRNNDGLRQRRGHRDRELVLRRRARQQRARQHRRHPRLRPARASSRRAGTTCASSTTQIVNNNTENFALSGDIVGLVPGGHRVLRHGRTTTSRCSATPSRATRPRRVGIISYATSRRCRSPTRSYYQCPKNIYAPRQHVRGQRHARPTRGPRWASCSTTGMADIPGHARARRDVRRHRRPGQLRRGAEPDARSASTSRGATAVCDMHFDQLDTDATPTWPRSSTARVAASRARCPRWRR